MPPLFGNSQLDGMCHILAFPRDQILFGRAPTELWGPVPAGFTALSKSSTGQMRACDTAYSPGIGSHNLSLPLARTCLCPMVIHSPAPLSAPVCSMHLSCLEHPTGKKASQGKAVWALNYLQHFCQSPHFSPAGKIVAVSRNMFPKTCESPRSK